MQIFAYSVLKTLIVSVVVMIWYRDVISLIFVAQHEFAQDFHYVSARQIAGV